MISFIHDSITVIKYIYQITCDVMMDIVPKRHSKIIYLRIVQQSGFSRAFAKICVVFIGDIGERFWHWATALLNTPLILTLKQRLKIVRDVVRILVKFYLSISIVYDAYDTITFFCSALISSILTHFGKIMSRVWSK